MIFTKFHNMCDVRKLLRLRLQLTVALSIDIVHPLDESVPAKYWKPLVSVWNLKQDSWHTMTVSMPSTTCFGLGYEL